MKRSLYSLILSDEVVSLVDEAADRAGTNRSHLIDEILADYVELITPAKRTRRIFEQTEKLLNDLDVTYAEHDNSLVIKSELDYRYHPTLRYDVEVNDKEATLAVSYRTRSIEFDSLMTRFFELWTEAEKEFAPNDKAKYSTVSGRWAKTEPLPDHALPDPGKRVSGYLKTLDTTLKKYVSGKIEAGDIRKEYRKAVKAGAIEA